MIRAPMWWTILHVVLWQGAWWGAVLGAAHGRLWLGPLLVAVVVVAQAVVLRRDMLITTAPIFCACGLGMIVDSGLGAVGALRMEGGGAGGIIAAPWMVGLWALLMTAFPCSLAWLRGRTVLAMALGAVGGPLAYSGGVALGALGQPPLGTGLSLTLIGVAWAAAMPVLLRIDGFFQEAATGPNETYGTRGCGHG